MIREGTFRFGAFRILVTKDDGRWHLSMVHPRRYPTYEEIKNIRYTFLPDDIAIAMVFPPPELFINSHDRCFHLWEVRDNFIEWTLDDKEKMDRFRKALGGDR